MNEQTFTNFDPTMQTQPTTDFLDQVKLGKNSWWRYTLSILFILFIWQVIGAIPYAFIYLLHLTDNQIVTFIALNFSFLCLFGGILLSVRLIHHRRLTSLITGSKKISFKHIFAAGLLWSVIVIFITIIDALIHPGSYQLTLDWKTWLVFLPFAVVLTPIQTTSEELLFRGYFLQGLSYLTKRKWILSIISGVIFAIPHFLNPEMAQGFVLLAAYYFIFGFILTWITLKSNQLEFAIGVHAANNLTTVLFANYTGSALPSPSIFTASIVDPLFNLVSFILGAGILWLLLFKVFPNTGWLDKR